jgi:WD40 repeat protein
VKVGYIQKKFVFEEKKDYKRSITSLDWSTAHPELFLASYSKMRDWSDEPDGFINIYSVAMQTRPEITLNCQYEVTKAMFNPHDPNIVIGATTSGYILVWDVRAKKDPVRSIDRRDRSKPI